MELVFTQSEHPLLTGKRKFRNPRFFSGVEQASKVFIVGDYPHIADAYRAEGVEVEVIGGPVEKPQPNFSALDPAAVVIPDGWERYGWQDLRKLANALGARAPNKAGAAEVIAAEQARRAQAVQDAEAAVGK